MDVNPMVSKSEIGHFQLGKGPSRGLLRDCEIFVNLRITFVWSWITNCHLLTPVSARGVAWRREYDETMSMNLKSQGLVKHCLQVWTGIGN